jgi:hypothetical protein
MQDVDLKQAEEVRRELFELREAYESKVWECADLEDSVNLLEEEIEACDCSFLLTCLGLCCLSVSIILPCNGRGADECLQQTTRKLDTLAKAKAQADALDSALAATAEATQARLTQMQQLEQLKSQLVRDMQDARRMLAVCRFSLRAPMLTFPHTGGEFVEAGNEGRTHAQEGMAAKGIEEP